MPQAHGYLNLLLNRLGELRRRSGITEDELEDQLILGPGWIRRFETGESIPSIDMVLAILNATNATLSELLHNLSEPEAATVERCIFAEQAGDDITLYFRYADHDAQYRIPNSSLDEFEEILQALRDGLSGTTNSSSESQNARRVSAMKMDAVATAFLKAVHLWPHANPSDLWWFVVYRAYCDPYNHPAKFARLNFDQSWKRTGGWALEEILVRHYGPFLKRHGINLLVAKGPTKRTLTNMIDELNVGERVETDKIDVVLTGDTQFGQKFFGIIHVKASIAERRTDDVPLSKALIAKGCTSAFWTMDCKSTPSAHPINYGELGPIDGRLSAKRRDFEEVGNFTGCFSYNQRTIPSHRNLPIEQRITVCDFQNPDDEFSRFIISRWRAFPKT